jgi:hypothetical protein
VKVVERCCLQCVSIACWLLCVPCDDGMSLELAITRSIVGGTSACLDTTLRHSREINGHVIRARRSEDRQRLTDRWQIANTAASTDSHWGIVMYSHWPDVDNHLPLRRMDCRTSISRRFDIATTVGRLMCFGPSQRECREGQSSVVRKCKTASRI